MSRWCRCDHLSQHEKHVVIKNLKSEMVLDATENDIQLQPLSGSLSQLWTLECTQNGQFIIINKRTQKVLDIENEAQERSPVVTTKRNGGQNQQWYINSDGSIALAGGIDLDLVLDVSESTYEAGSSIIVFKKHGGDNQKFLLEYK